MNAQVGENKKARSSTLGGKNNYPCFRGEEIEG